MSFSLIYITYPNKAEAERICDALLRAKLVAGANIFSAQSAYWWKGQVQSEEEWISVLQTSDANWTELKQRVANLHSYEVPCIIRMQAEANQSYEQWVEDTTQP